MSLSSTVSLLSREVKNQLHDLSSSQQEMLDILGRLPEYNRINNLALFNADFKNAIDDNEENDFNYRIIEMVYELIDINLFGAYQPKATKKYYKRLVKLLGEYNIKITRNLNVKNW